MAFTAIVAVASVLPGNAAKAPAAAAMPTVSAAVVVKPAMNRTLTAKAIGFGTVQPDLNAVVAVNAPYAAVVGRLFVRAGEAVSKGQKLVALSTSAAAAATFAQAKAQVSYAHGELQRQKRLLGQQLATHAQVAQARNALTDAQSKLEALQRVGTGQPQTVLRAQESATVAAVTAKTGQLLVQGGAILALAPQRALIVRLGVAPERAAAVRPGMEVTLRDVLDPGRTRMGKVASVSAVVDPKTRLRDVLVDITPGSAATAPQPATDPLPTAGTFVRGVITLNTARVLVVPREAILLDQHGRYVFVVRNGHAHRVAVTTGLESANAVAVTGALHAGDPVVVQGNYELTEGMQVHEVAR
ncbi:MAG: efflux RND transporter periplasmic adaptor subunit [Acetobacteraceae bacterium]